jgi:hypothetical protein
VIVIAVCGFRSYFLLLFVAIDSCCIFGVIVIAVCGFPRRFTFVICDVIDSPSFDLGIPLDCSKRKHTKRTKPIVRKKPAFTNAHDAALSLGISKQPANVFLASGSDIFSRVPDPASAIDVSNMPLVDSGSPFFVLA